MTPNRGRDDTPWRTKRPRPAREFKKVAPAKWRSKNESGVYVEWAMTIHREKNQSVSIKMMDVEIDYEASGQILRRRQGFYYSGDE